MYFFQKIMLNVSDIDMYNTSPYPWCSTSQDIAHVYDGNTWLDALCHSQPNFQIYHSTINTLSLEFHTDSTNVTNGFKMQWSELGGHH